ncbi:putative family protein [Phaeomoniella chlamydospora]|uniref:Putative family protein n=1 Tax=Phaeomoniella chlamydospora TaxID=158046 RepID=A0A0G2HFF4_PHACM|nr:putative family protein [Phaeomoniella chlamydospora]
MSAIAENGDGPQQVIQVLFALFPDFGTLDFTGPLEVFNYAQHDPKNPTSKAFETTICGPSPTLTSSHGLQIRTDISYETAHEDIGEYDILVVVGGIKGANKILEAKKPSELEPIKLIQAFARLQEEDPRKERSILGVCTGSLLLAQAGILQGLSATTHPEYAITMEIICQRQSLAGSGEHTTVMEQERYVVNNARFDLGENINENPFVLSKRPDGRRKSLARKGSNAWQESVKRRESIIKRAAMKLGGLRVITSGGVMSGVDASLYLVAAMVSHESATEIARVLEYAWQKGTTVEGVDV